MKDEAQRKAMGLSCWHGDVDAKPISGGITNENFVVEHDGQRFFVRIGEDIPVHGVMRFNEHAASRAAAAVGISPEVLFAQPGALVLRFIEGRTLGEDDVRRRENLERIVTLLRRAHREIPNNLRGPALVFWVFQVIRDYAATLRVDSGRMVPELPRLLEAARALEREIGSIELRFGHNDLLCGNFIDDGERLWLVDWDYAGFNSPLFDLGGLASNNQLSPDQESWLLETYFEQPVTESLQRRYAAMKCASLLRESMWSMVSEIHSSLDVDYEAYTAENLARFESAWTRFRSS